MKKITLLLIMFTGFSYSQDSKIKAYIEKTETISFEQYDLIKKVNEFYPDILVSKQIKNNYINDLKNQVYLDSNLVFEIPSDCKAYEVKLLSSSLLSYSYLLNDETYITGDIKLFNGDYVRTLFKAKGNSRVIQYYINGKLINEKKV